MFHPAGTTRRLSIDGRASWQIFERMERVRVGIVGAGALGLLIASRLTLAGFPPVVFMRSGSSGDHHHQSIDFQPFQGQGVKVTLPFTNDLTRSGSLDMLIVLVPSWATREALSPFAASLPSGSLVVSLQNGLGNDTAIKEALPDHDPSRIAIGVTSHGAWRPSPWSVIHAGIGETSIGLVTAGTTDHLKPVANHLSAAGIETRITEQIMPLVWRKLAVSAALNGLTAVTGLPNGAIAEEPELQAVAVAIASEVAAVARARDIEIDDPGQQVTDIARSTSSNRSSMLSSLEAGRRTEVEAIHGAVVSMARDAGIAVPLTTMLAAIIRGRERANARAQSPTHDR